MNPNCNNDLEINQSIPEIEIRQKHACLVWKNHIERSGFKNLFVIAHSAGGDCIMAI